MTCEGGLAMGQITLRPELMTPGGQAASIMLNDGYVGSFAAVYRENDALFGLVHLDKETLKEADKDKVNRFIQDYVQNMAQSLNVDQCSVILTYSEPGQVLDTEDLLGEEVYVDVVDDDDHNLVIEWVREDVDALILDVYEEEDRESIYLGRITVNLGDKDLTALVEFEHPGNGELREQLAYHLVDLLEEEYDFETITITMQYNDEVIDEYHFDYADQEEERTAGEREGPQAYR